jgi:tetratricopeptide (TPR) repeat protein
LEKAIEIKRRAQRCILNGDLDGALAEYEKLLGGGESDPYYCVLVADLLYKKGAAADAQRRYFEAIDGYEKGALYKNGIAVCKKMSRLSLAPTEVLRRLAGLHALDGLATEAALAYLQHAELMIKHDRLDDARTSLKHAIETNPDAARAQERLAEVEFLAGDPAASEQAWNEAAAAHEKVGARSEAERCRAQARKARGGAPDGAPVASRPVAVEDDDTGPPVASAAPVVEETSAPSKPSPANEALFGSFMSTPPGLRLDDEGDARAGGGTIELEDAASDADDADSPPVLRDPVASRARKDEEQEDAVEEDPVEAEASLVDEDDSLPPIEPEPAPPKSKKPTPVEAKSAPDRGLSLTGLDPDDYSAANSKARESKNGERPAAANETADAPLTLQRLDETPPRPSLREAADGSASEDAGLAEVSGLLAEAQNLFQSGNREAATSALVRAAQAYDRLARYDSAAAIYRSLGQSPDSSLQLMLLWLKNCQRRNDPREAARVACDLGDRALNEGDLPGAREWFERARAYDPQNELADRRIRHLDRETPTHAPATSPAPEEPAILAATARTAQGLHVKTENDEEVVDLGTLIEEFQRAVVPELAEDPQGNYDLAMSYREMGLLDEAVEAFGVAARDPSFRLRANELAGRCLLDLGRLDDAARVLRSALDAPNAGAEALAHVRYQLALALEAAGDNEEALREFERVYVTQGNFADVTTKIRALRKALGTT